MKHEQVSAGQPVSHVAPISERLDALADLILAWNQRINLMSRGDVGVLRTRHIQDCLQLVPLLPPMISPIADMGSGAGLPGLVLAIAQARPVHLVEADRRKAAFLTEAAARLGLKSVTVHPVRIETLRLPGVGVVTARALAPLNELLAFAEPLIGQRGVALFPKGRGAEQEVNAARLRWTFDIERHPSTTDPDGCILRVSAIRRAI
ncbi:16S rRNA (guanine(527)-N(7))-methyltransferase RsmG [Leptolyngbya sp. 15MV]|nr:16S rRNA (guanine(527)-N(7))-methyltransferase RsmG [Leptolyngbya sp. 15MV]